MVTPTEDGYWLVRTSKEKMIVKIDRKITFLGSPLVGIPGYAWKSIGSFERDWRVIEWIRKIEIKEL